MNRIFFRVCSLVTQTLPGSQMVTQTDTHRMNTRYLSSVRYKKKHTFDKEHCNPVALNSVRSEWDTRLFSSPTFLVFQEREEPGRREVMERSSRSGGGPAQGFSYQESSSRWLVTIHCDQWSLVAQISLSLNQATAFMIYDTIQPQSAAFFMHWQRMINTATDTSFRRS